MRGSGFVWCLIVQHSSPLSVPGEGLAAAADEPLPNVAVPVSTEETVETGLINVKDIVPDPAAYKVSEVLRSHL